MLKETLKVNEYGNSTTIAPSNHVVEIIFLRKLTAVVGCLEGFKHKEQKNEINFKDDFSSQIRIFFLLLLS